jgi:hypothetical protein
MGTIVRIMNVGRGEAIFRGIIGIILIFFAFFVRSLFCWILGLIGVGLILTAIFKY